MKINSSDCSGDGASCENETNYTDHGKQSNELGHARTSVSTLLFHLLSVVCTLSDIGLY